ncbi:MAG: tryptophan synthase subunit alpha [Candidatus Omnitrophica bacterium]|nr:tryptophan synthase subunit alpha [Candidatus Omnitrophota bacterium]HOX53862.1 tryptophan synthase subunit alpha [Candidatus Omnitrophota bacterium]
MKNRIDAKFRALKKARKKAFIVFIMAGDPNIEATRKLVLAFDKIGVDIVELGVAFSDPLADGPIIQAAGQRALKNKINLDKILGLVKSIRQKSQVPLALMTYYNPVFRFGEKKFLLAAKKSGVDGIIIPDIIPEEEGEIIKTAKKIGLANILFVAPTSNKKRIEAAARLSTGFIYYVSLSGVTGVRRNLASDLSRKVREIKKFTLKPVCVGFGISNASHVREISKVADGVIIGSAIVDKIQKNLSNKDLVGKVSQFVKQLKSPLK